MKEYKEYNDEKLCELSKTDENAREVLIERYLYLVNKYRKDTNIKGEDFSDIEQEGRIAINRAIDTYNGKASFKTYAYNLVTNQINSFLRNTKAKKNYVLNNSDLFSKLFDEANDKSDIVMDVESKNPEQTYIQKEDERIFFEEVKKILSSLEYKIFIMRFVENCSYEEIGNKTKKDAKSIENALTRIKNKIKKIRG